jgi:hypothetical protein
VRFVVQVSGDTCDTCSVYFYEVWVGVEEDVFFCSCGGGLRLNYIYTER